VLTGLSLSVPTRSRFALLGPNGAGKSTLLRILCNLLAPKRGQVLVLGCSLPAQFDQVKAKLGYLPDNPPLYEQFSPMEHFDLIATLWGLPQAIVRERAEEYLHLLGLWHERNTWVERFSKGMRRKVALISVLVRRPPLLLLDEPLDGLDPESTDVAIELLRNYSREGTVLFTSHNQYLVDALADHAGILANGRIQWVGLYRPGQMDTHPVGKDVTG
ncbi:ATP-binding cassette domain-containing protein, partial [Symbiobacterium thermophilum]